jgi:nucleosome binding factor SPN SPT16 subunit
MSFLVTTGLRDIPMSDKHDSANAKVNALSFYSILLADTVLITPDGPVVLTEKATRVLKEVSYEMAGGEEGGEGEEEEEDGRDRSGSARASKKDKSERRQRGVIADPNAGRDETGRSARLKEKAKDVDPDASKRRDEHQASLVVKKNEAAMKKKSGDKGGAGADADADAEMAADIASYQSMIEYPVRPRLNQILVDKTHDAVLVPWQGTLVPISLLAIKSITKSDEGGVKHFLRFNFFTPGGALGKDIAPQMAGAITRNPNAVYVKTLNFMSRDGRNFANVEQTVKAMLKKLREARKEEKATADIVEQPRVIPSRGTGAPPSLADINMWPPYSGRGRTSGTLSCHTNGFIYRSSKNETVEIPFSNVKVGIFQPCDNEHIVLLHFSLRHAILLGKKKRALCC